MKVLMTALLALSFTTQAKFFSSQYCEFELPNGWECSLEGSEWVCQSDNKDRRKEAIIILAAKTRGQQDTLDQYQAYLKKKKSFQLPGGKTQVSEPKYAKVNEINGHRWVDALHLASEVPGFWTRYLATVKEDLGVAVTFSVGKDFYNVYQPVFDRVVSTLRVFRNKKVDLNPKLAGYTNANNIEDTPFVPTGDEIMDIAAPQKKRKAKSGGGTTDLILYGGLALLVLIILLKKKK